MQIIPFKEKKEFMLQKGFFHNENNLRDLKEFANTSSGYSKSAALIVALFIHFANQLSDKRCPSGLMACSQPIAIVTMKIFIK